MTEERDAQSQRPSSRTSSNEEDTGMPRHAVKHQKRSAARIAGVTATAVVLFLVSGLVVQAVRLNGNLSKAGDFSSLIDTTPSPRDTNRGQDLNILILGTDDRSGDNAELSGDDYEGARSDTTIIAHISADRSRVDLVSIARDTVVDVPACHLSRNDVDTMSSPASSVKFNSAFAYGAAANTGDHLDDLTLGAACTISTIQQQTGIAIDDFVIIDFKGFQTMVDAIGGIDVNVPQAVDDTQYVHLTISSGEHHMDGTTALKYARVRHGVGDGSDTQRMPRQQTVIAAIAAKAMSGEVLANPLKLQNFLSAATQSLTVSSGMDSINDMAGLVWSLKGINTDKITFATAPTVNVANGNVAWTDEAKLLWQDIIDDQPITSISTARPFNDAKTGVDLAPSPNTSSSASTQAAR